MNICTDFYVTNFYSGNLLSTFVEHLMNAIENKQPDIPEGYHYCTRCRNIKTLDNFGKRWDTKRPNSYCKQCHNEYKKHLYHEKKSCQF